MIELKKYMNFSYVSIYKICLSLIYFKGLIMGVQVDMKFLFEWLLVIDIRERELVFLKGLVF